MKTLLAPMKKPQLSRFQPNQNVEFHESQLQLEKNQMTWRKYPFLRKEI